MSMVADDPSNIFDVDETLSSIREDLERDNVSIDAFEPLKVIIVLLEVIDFIIADLDFANEELLLLVNAIDLLLEMFLNFVPTVKDVKLELEIMGDVFTLVDVPDIR